MNRKRYNYIRRLVEKITTSPSNNMEFCYYGHLVSLQSGTTDYVDITVYNTADRRAKRLISASTIGRRSWTLGTRKATVCLMS